MLEITRSGQVYARFGVPRRMQSSRVYQEGRLLNSVWGEKVRVRGGKEPLPAIL